MVTGIIPTLGKASASTDTSPVADMPPGAVATLSAMQSSQAQTESNLAETTSKLNLVTSQLNDAQTQLASTQKELAALQDQNNVGPPQDIQALQDQIAVLKTQIEQLTSYGQRTRLGDQMVNAAAILGWTYQEKPCQEFGQDKNQLLADGITAITWEGISWEYSKCFVGFEGWDKSAEKGDTYLSLMYEWSFSYSCSWEPHTTYFEVWQPNGDKKLQNMITVDLLGNPNPQSLIDKFYGKGLYPTFYQDHGFWCTKDVRTLGAEEVIFRLWPITLSQADDLIFQGERNIHWRRQQ